MERLKKGILSFLCRFLRLLFLLRYQITIQGKKELSAEKLSRPGGILFLPNHPALVDPLILFAFLYPRYPLRPLVVEYIFRKPWLQFFFRFAKSLAIPNFEAATNDVKLAKVQESLEEIAKGLKAKENYLIYPAGRLKHEGKEIVGGASAIEAILQKVPEANVVLVRTSGLWGSSFSRAFLGRSPDFIKTLLQNGKFLLKNGLLFMPKRKILIEISSNPSDFPWKGSRIEVNRFLQNWYNQYPSGKEGKERVEEEPLYLVSYLFWKKRFPTIVCKEKRKKEELSTIEISPKIREEVFDALAKISRIEKNEIREEQEFAADLGLDSLDIAELSSFLFLHYNVEEIHPEDLISVRDSLEIAQGRKSLREDQEISLEKEKSFWPEEKKRPPLQKPLGKTLEESFLLLSDIMGKRAACADDIVGVVSYRKMKISALVLAQKIKKMEGNRIGILLPSSIAAYLLILAILLSGKVPVMLNWTLGPRCLESMASLGEVKVVLSSWKFLERLSNVELRSLRKKLALLEEVKGEISLFLKGKELLRSFLPTKILLKSLSLKTTPQDSCVILFTSGTEADPKGVPLSHENVLSNMSAALDCVFLKESDILYGILPPFHSFGFTASGLLPLLIGMKVAFAPDPLDSYFLAKGIRRWKASLLLAAPSFLKALLQVATKEDIKTLRLFVTGAEKAPSELFTKVKELHSELIEGYGITECAPILTMNRPFSLPRGVGKALPGIELAVVHPESRDLLSIGKEGEICARGKNIFSGYLGKAKNPFIELQGKKWYATGDLGFLDSEGNLFLSGRLKRFAKIGGEMVSLSALEEVLKEALAKENPEKIPSVAVCEKGEKEGEKAALILFTTATLDERKANLLLKEAGFSRLVKFSEVRILSEIPLTGTGKTDYRLLQSQL